MSRSYGRGSNLHRGRHDIRKLYIVDLIEEKTEIRLPKCSSSVIIKNGADPDEIENRSGSKKGSLKLL